jgi:hypothetical protein
VQTDAPVLIHCFCACTCVRVCVCMRSEQINKQNDTDFYSNSRQFKFTPTYYINLPRSRTSSRKTRYCVSNTNVSQTPPCLKHQCVSNTPVYQTPMCLKHHCVSNTTVYPTPPCLKHHRVSNTTVSQTPVSNTTVSQTPCLKHQCLQHHCVSNATVSQTPLCLKHATLRSTPTLAVCAGKCYFFVQVRFNRSEQKFWQFEKNLCLCRKCVPCLSYMHNQNSVWKEK